MSLFARGSEWRKWDLQIQTILDDRYEPLRSYYQELKNNSPDLWDEFVNKVGGEENALKFDSKEYFHETKVSEKVRCNDYVRNFFAFIQTFHKNELNKLGCIGITDHNYSHPVLIDAFYEYSKNDTAAIKVIPGVEINCSGVHILVYFGDIPYEQTSYSKAIEKFLSKLDINSPKKGGNLTVCHKSVKDVLDDVNKIGGVAIFAHCNSDNGLFQEKGKADRTYLADIYNHKDPIILECKSKEAIENLQQFIRTRPNLLNTPIFTISSDGRCLRDYFSSDPRGNHCWIKGDCSIDGLKQVIYEKDGRISITTEPELFNRVKSHSTKFINKLIINQNENYDGSKGVWFKNVEIIFNHELVAIIGNKGGGKSAISDIIGLIGNSHNAGPNQSHFSFLSNDKSKHRFRKKGFAENFYAALEWQSGDSVSKSLSDEVDHDEVERVKYLPQNYFEYLTNNLESTGFESTLKNVIFHHVPESEKLGLASFEELEKKKMGIVDREIETVLQSLIEINTKIINLEAKSTDGYIRQINSSLSEKMNELRELDKSKPLEIPKPDSISKSEEELNLLEELAEFNKQKNDILEEVENSKLTLKTLNIEKHELNELLSELLSFEKTLESYKTSKSSRFRLYGLNIEDMLTLGINFSPLKKIIKSKEEEINTILPTLVRDETDKSHAESYFNQLEKINKKIDELSKKLNRKNLEYQEYLVSINKWSSQRKNLIGSSDLQGTLKYFEAEKAYADNVLASDLNYLRILRIKKCQELYRYKYELIKLYHILKQSIDTRLNHDFEFRDKFNMSIEVSFRIKQEFQDRFLSYINKKKQGTFYGIDEGRKQIDQVLSEKDFMNESGVEEFLTEIVNALEEDRRQEINGERRRNISDQIQRVDEFYNYLFGLSYLEPIYQLKLDGKLIEELSPGERGSLLLIFYLLIDKQDIPLIIDQPEDNLDNKSVYEILTHFIKYAKKRRQIIIVTHNPNLAVGADAEQIIYVNLDKANGHTFSYKSGSIENTEINKKIVEVLEGTMPAFDKRKLKYVY